MENFIRFFPFVLGVILIIIGMGIIIYRTKGAFHAVGVITDIAKTERKQAKVQFTAEAPVVRYSLNGKEYNRVSQKFFTQGVMNFEKGKNIKIRISRRNPMHFVPDESGRMAEKLIIACGVFMILANAAILWRY